MELSYIIIGLLVAVIGCQIYLIDRLNKVSSEISLAKSKLYKVVLKFSQKNSSFNNKNFELLSGHIDNRLDSKIRGMETLIKDNTDKLWDKIDDTHDSLLS